MTDGALFHDYCAKIAAGTGPVALDAERASGFRYSQRAYLIQVRRQGAGTALIDPIAIPDLTPLNDAIGDAEWILHAATQDLACLAEVGLRPTSLFDTELAGRLLGRERVSLAALVASELGEHLEKGHGAADWSLRPLSPAQLRYAALDVELLIELRDTLEQELVDAGKDSLARQEFDHLLGFQPRTRGEDEWRRTSGVHKVRKPQELAVVRELWRARDELAESKDIAVGRLIPDSAIVIAAQSNAADKSDLLAVKGFHGRGAQRYIGRWWDAIQRARSLPSDEWPGPAPRAEGPPPARSWPDRDPVAARRLAAARTLLADIADDLAMPVENVLTPDTLRRLCWSPPDPITAETVGRDLSDQGARAWQVEACVNELVTILIDAEHTEVTDE